MASRHHAPSLPAAGRLHTCRPDDVPLRRRPPRPSLGQRPAKDAHQPTGERGGSAKGDAEPAAAAFVGEADDVAAVVWATCRARARPRPSMLPMPPISRETLTATG